MFDYDRLALDVAQEFSGNNSIFRALHGEHLPAKPSNEENKVNPDFSTLDIFDCGSSSGYGSPGVGGTPLASPAPNSGSFISHSVQKMLLEQGFYNDLKSPGSKPIGINNKNSPLNPQDFVSSLFSGMTIDQIDDSVHNEQKTDKRSSSSGSNCSAFSPPASQTVPKPPVVATEDGFSQDEIAQFAELLCSPKKTPPTRYQCHICYNTGHYISDCPMRFNTPYEELTPYQGRKKCYGEFTCQQCKRRWTSQNSVANEAQSCIKCHVPVFPHKQLPVDKAVALGLVKAQRTVPTKIAPIGHGRPPFSAASVRH